jgi:hypothetical protein
MTDGRKRCTTTSRGSPGKKDGQAITYVGRGKISLNHPFAHDQISVVPQHQSSSLEPSELPSAESSNTEATISVVWGHEPYSITLTPEHWAKVKSGDSLSIEGGGYHYEGTAFEISGLLAAGSTARLRSSTAPSMRLPTLVSGFPARSGPQ